MHIPRAHLFPFAAALCLLISSAALAQRIVLAQANAPDSASRIVSAVDDARRVTLAGNTHPLARGQFDQGRVADGTRLRRMLLVLGRSQQQESALKELIDEQQDKSSSSYHQWLTPQVFGEEFGPSERDLDAVTAWLTDSIEPAQIKSIRESQQVSQPVFARYLNTRESTVEKWEAGVKKPSGMAIKLLMIVQKHGLKMLA